MLLANTLLTVSLLTLPLASGIHDSSMSGSMHGRVVVVTGAGTGIGRATARQFASRGDQVLAIGRRPEPLAETAGSDELIRTLSADVAADDAAGAIVEHVNSTYGRLDVLVNNAGIVRSGALGDLAADAIDLQLATNLVAPMMLAQAALPLLADARGVIVNITTSIGAARLAG